MNISLALTSAFAGALLLPALLLPFRTAACAATATHHATTHGHAAKRPVASLAEDSWKPKPALLDKLAPESESGGFRLRLPPGYTLAGTEDFPSANGIFTLDMYYGDKRSDNSIPAIGIVTSRSSQFNVTSDPSGLLDKMLIAVERRTTDGKPGLVISPREYGRIHGVVAAREYFKFTYVDQTGAHYKAHGFYYAMLTSDQAMMFFGMDTEPFNKETLPLAEASALTIHQ